MVKSVSHIALGVALALGGAGLVAPAAAQRQQATVSELSREERAALLALRTALETRNYAAAATALTTAQSAARSGYARYLASALQLRLGTETGNPGLQSSAIDAMIASGAAPAETLPQLYRNQAAFAQAAGKADRAEAALTRYLELVPNDAEALIALSQIQNDRRRPREAVAVVDRALAARAASGQPAPEHWYRRGLHLALVSQAAPQSLSFSRQLVAAYPSAVNWRDALLVYRDVAKPDPATALDAWRLMRAAKALAGERDYLQFAQALNTAGLAAEARAVLDEGAAAKMIDPAKPAFKELISSTGKRATAGRAGLAGRQASALAAATGTAALDAGDAFFGYGEHAKAAALYRAAAQKGGVDVNLANQRLGAALALAGQRAEAEAALRSVTGPRADLAQLWLVWLAQRA